MIKTQDILEGTKGHVIGRRKELEILLSAYLTGQHILLEGPPGTSKSTLLRYVTDKLNVPLFHVEGSADLTPAKLIGTFNPSLVLEQGFKPEFFEPGPLSQAMQKGGILYIDELNRAAPDATNALIRAMEEGELVVPRYGTIKAADGFRVVSAMNPYDDAGVTRLSRALFDRMSRMKMSYQRPEEELEIVTGEVTSAPEVIKKLGVQIGRATRSDDRLRQGSSVRGAIDFAKLAESLADIRGGYSVQLLLDAAYTAFSGKIWIESPGVTEEEVIIDIVESALMNLDDSFFDELNIEKKTKTGTQ